MTKPAIPGASKRVLPALRLVQSSLNIRRLGNLAMVLLMLTILGMLFLPWQQSAKGTGNVTAFVPQERQQSVMAPMKGIVERVDPNLVEGMQVAKGDFILELQPSAADMEEQIEQQRRFLLEKLQNTETKAELYQQVVVDLTAARDYAVSAAEDMVLSAEAKLRGVERLVEGYRSKEWQARKNYERQAGLSEKGIKPDREVEVLKKDLDFASAELEKVQEDVTASQRELDAKRSGVEQIRREMDTKIDAARGMKQTALSEQNSIDKEISDLDIKLGELKRLVIRAPRDGTIFRMPVFERGQVIKEGEPLLTIVPETEDLVVELWVDGIDVPLIRVGDHVRLQFEGWPAVQFAGWPSVAVGTFGGEVFALDRSDNGKGKFRVQIRPIADDKWPSERYLRQGVRANGWVMLQQVSLGYEIWRQLNGFPPVVADEEPKFDKPAKPPLPK